ncbi:LysM peptidoglycan-binding domain-containing protein [Pseudomonas sp. N040]|uniref:LysM peptidoglycan-binding domain-containing protein n=1 Tax=Pseudomonas sp. N040 TaxID=2785325 RepID=UPI0018A318C9|nr:LysM peptidoglycan-binding domain-containing protein [Pseudomonas sp. N040]MBF7728855.1 LysM peptidoglycan-binding domain-containing protein [Pseudomonas sp. N040]MBW7012495.1 LysM peptidoglycan-binding domain-containing protein [Pseudomonas sp. N040]
MRKSLLALLLLAAGSLAQAEVQLRNDHPQSYTVVKGDTLWDISGKFLTEPWKWPEIWHANPQIQNPDLIYPGDTLNLVYVNGQPQLSLSRGESRGTIKLSPEVRSTPMAEAIPPIPLEVINAFLVNNRIMDSEAQFNEAPYVVAGEGQGVVYGAGNTIYARGAFAGSDAVRRIFRQGKVYSDPVTNEFLGINANNIGTAEIKAVEGEVATLYVSQSNEEVRRGDRLFETLEYAVNSSFQPSAPSQPIDGQIIDVPRGVTTIGAMDVVTLNKGARDGLVPGSTLAIFRTGETVRDVETGQPLKMPDENAGVLMVFRAFDKISYALVLRAHRQLSVGDKVANP